MSTATVIGMSHKNQYLVVRSDIPRKEFERGGSNYGYQYEWNVNHFSFTKSRKHYQEFLKLSDEEYSMWDSKFSHRVDSDDGQWYWDEDKI